MRAMTLESHTEQECSDDAATASPWRRADPGFVDTSSQSGAEFYRRQFHAPYLSTIRARTLIVHGDRDSLYPIHMPCELHQSIPGSRLWIVPNGDHGMIFKNRLLALSKRCGLLGEGRIDPSPGHD